MKILTYICQVIQHMDQRSIGAVSYTHLDVYKRQGLGSLMNLKINFANGDIFYNIIKK